MINIEVPNSLIKSKYIVDSVINDYSLRNSNIDFSGYVSTYRNGREQGYTIVLGLDHAYYISEHRSSDDIVVYFGKYSSNSLSEDAYNNSHFFSYNKENECIDFIVSSILETCKRLKKGGD